jgi:hypothetical protein
MKILHQILKYNPDVVSLSLGQFGTTLYNFSKNLDFDHFGVVDIPIEESLSEKLCQILELVSYAIDHNLNEAIFGISKFYTKSIANELHNLDKKFVRLIKNNDLKNEIRKNKKSCNVSLITFYEKARLIWDSLPDDFTIFSRYSEEYKQMIRSAEIMAQRYKEIGCDDLFENIQKSIKSTQESMEDVYQGFHRISIKNAAIILAKVNRFNLIKKQMPNIVDKQNYLIYLNNSIYSPKIYPLFEFESIYTERVHNLLGELENPSFFDYYMVMVPSVDSMTKENDMDSIKEKNIIPIVIGEKDGKCYFISYWI